MDLSMDLADVRLCSPSVRIKARGHGGKDCEGLHGGLRSNRLCHAIIPAHGGPDNFANVDGLAWTDQQGLGELDGKRFRIRGGKSIDFYVPITNPAIFGGVRLKADYAAVTFSLPPTALLIAFQVIDRTTPVFSRDGLAVTGNFRRVWVENSNAFILSENMEVQGALAIKVTILSGAETDITFTGAGIRFHN